MDRHIGKNEINRQQKQIITSKIIKKVWNESKITKKRQNKKFWDE